MKIYSIYGGEEPEYFRSKSAALDRAREIAKAEYEDGDGKPVTVEVTVNHVAKMAMGDLILSILNRNGWAAGRPEIACTFTYQGGRRT